LSYSPTNFDVIETRSDPKQIPFYRNLKEPRMKASDVMNRNVITVGQHAGVEEAIRLLGENDISALPVIDETGTVVGILSEADLVHRSEIGTDTKHRWWIEAITPAAALAEEFTKSHARKVDELMSRNVISASEDTSLADIASLLEKHRIKRVPIIENGKLVGIVSRANLVQALASSTLSASPQADVDRAIRLEILSRLAEQPWTTFGERNIIVTDGMVHLWGLAGSQQEHEGLIVLAENVPGVTQVKDEMISAY
jgi:CBS domain-containing protein